MLDILSIQETKIDDIFPQHQFHVNRFKQYRNDHKCNEGISLLYVRNDFPQQRMQDVEKFAVDNERGHVELINVEITVRCEKWVI